MSAEARILIVDDNAANRALAQAVLEDDGYVAMVAVDGAEALRMIEEDTPDCVFARRAHAEHGRF